ncbi:MAG: Ig-like domain repeat protein, partial [Actinobacteria bacterium]|nr:Ig-like domain repeat protein [Actinomycetota bacterium]
VTTTDLAGNSFVSGTITVRVDNTAPTGSLTAPANGVNLHGSAVTLTSDSADGGSGVATVVFERSPSGAGTWTAQASPWNTTEVGDGLYDLRVTTTDNAGNAFTSGTITVHVDNTAPVTTASASPGTTSNTTVTVTLSASDGSGSGVSATQYRVDSGGWTSGTTVVIAAPSDHSNDGTHTIEFYSTDAVGNVESTKSVAITIDTTGPSGAPGDPGSYLRGTAAALDFTPDTPADVASVEFEFSPAGMDTWASLGTVLSPGPYTYLWNTTLVTDGDYDLRVNASDSLGNMTTQPLPDLPTRVDNTAPSAGVSAPAPGAFVAGSVTLSGFASDAGSGIASLQLQVKATGAADFSTVATSGASPVSVAWNSTAAPDGPADLRVLATDNAGNTVTSAVRTITVDNNAPTVTLNDPGAFVAGTVTLSASSAADTAQVVFQRSPAGANTWTTIATDTSAPFEASLDTTALADGLYDLRAIATDAGGNTGTSAIRTTTVDNVAPAGTLTQPAAGQTVGGPSVQLAATASDAAAGVASVVWQAKLAGAPGFSTVATDTSAPFATTWDATSVPDGPAEVRIVVTDAAGNTSTSSPVAVTVDSTAPTVTLGDPGALVSGVIALTAATSGAGASQVAFGVSPADAETWTAFATDTAAPWTASLDTATLPDGLYDLRAVVSDSLGNTNWFVREDVRVDNTAPALAGSVPADGSVLTGVASVAVTASEPVTVVGALLDGAATAAPSVSGNTLTFATGSLGEGLHVLSGQLEDVRGARTQFRVAFTVWTGGSADVAPVEMNVSSTATTTLTAVDSLATVSMPSAAWPAAGSTTPGDILVIRIDPMPSSTLGTAIQLSSQVFDVSARWALAGTPVTQFQAPLDIMLPNSSGSLVLPATSDDGIHWRQLPLVHETGVLPSTWADGFYRDGSGTVHVLTRHLTYFGLMLDVEAPTPPGGFVGVVADDGLTLRWTPARDNSGQLGQFILYVNGESYAQFDNTQFEVKMGAFATDDTRRFTMAQHDAAGNLGQQTAALKALPQLAGLAQAQAEAALAAAGFAVGSVTEQAGTGALAGTVLAPTGAGLALEGSSVDLVVAEGAAATTRLVFKVAGSKRIALAKRTTIAARLQSSRPAAVTATLYGTKKQRLYAWKLRVKAGAQIVQLRVPTQIRKPGRYTVSWVARSGTEAIQRTLTMRLLGPELEQVQPAKQQVEVVLAGEQPDREKIALGLRGTGTRLVESASRPERTFQLAGATDRNVGVVVVDVDVYGLGFLRDLRLVFPDLRLLALGSSPATLGRAVQAGANLALPRGTPSGELARMISELARQDS